MLTRRDTAVAARRRSMTKWTPERRAKFIATVRRKQLARTKKPHQHVASKIDIITYCNKALGCLEGRDLEGVELFIKMAKRAAQGKE